MVDSAPSSFPLFGDVVGYECESVINRKAFKVSQYIHNIFETPKSDADLNASIVRYITQFSLCKEDSGLFAPKTDIIITIYFNIGCRSVVHLFSGFQAKHCHEIVFKLF